MLAFALIMLSLVLLVILMCSVTGLMFVIFGCIAFWAAVIYLACSMLATPAGAQQVMRPEPVCIMHGSIARAASLLHQRHVPWTEARDRIVANLRTLEPEVSADQVAIAAYWYSAADPDIAGQVERATCEISGGVK